MCFSYEGHRGHAPCGLYPDAGIRAPFPEAAWIAPCVPRAHGPVPHTTDLVVGGMMTGQRARWRAACLAIAGLGCQRTNRALCLFREAAPWMSG